MKNKIQYNAAVKYLEKREYKIKHTNGIFFSIIGLVVSYFLILFVYKLISCIH